MFRKNAYALFLFLVAIVIVSVSLLYFLGNDEVRAPSTKSAAISLDPQNCTYGIEGKRVVLRNGRSEETAAPGSASRLVTQYFGNEVFGDFNNDGLTDSALLVTQNAGGSGTFYYAVAAFNSREGCQGTNAVYLGDRIAPQSTEWRDGELVFNYADRNPGDPMTIEPSIGVSRYLKLIGNKLVESSRKVLNLSEQELLSIPSSAFQQTDLEELNVSHNNITGAIQAEIRHLSDLKVLKLSSNAMTGVPAEIGQLQKLEVLDLSYNQLTGLPRELGNLKQLKILDLTGNPYSQQDLDYIKSKLPETVTILTNS